MKTETLTLGEIEKVRIRDRYRTKQKEYGMRKANNLRKSMSINISLYEIWSSSDAKTNQIVKIKGKSVKIN